jgi:hypothetical protein
MIVPMSMGEVIAIVLMVEMFVIAIVVVVMGISMIPIVPVVMEVSVITMAMAAVTVKAEVLPSAARVVASTFASTVPTMAGESIARCRERTADERESGDRGDEYKLHGHVPSR